jgi:hypothetical protein
LLVSEAAFLVLLHALVTLFPPFADLLARFLPADGDDADPLVSKVRAILPVEGAATGVRRILEAQALGVDLDELEGVDDP